MLTQLQQYLRLAAARGRATSRVGSFLVTIDEATANPFLNYAIPDDGARPSPAEVAALTAAFAERDRVPRLEYLEPSAPAVLRKLEAAGFQLEGRLRAMTASAAAHVALPAGYALATPEADGDRAAMIAAQHAAFGVAAPVDQEEVARSQAGEGAGMVVIAVRAPDGVIVGGGVARPPEGSGFTEVAGIAIAQAHRRRGLATALTAEITRRAVAAGVRTAFLTPGDDGAARVYERAGFTQVGRMLHLRLTTGPT